MNRQKLILISVFISIPIIAFYVFYNIGSEYRKAKDSINKSQSIEEVKEVFEHVKPELSLNQLAKIKIDVFSKLKQLKTNYTNKEIVEIHKWIVPDKNNLNILIIPDLSNRIIDNWKNDEILINNILNHTIQYSYNQFLNSKYFNNKIEILPCSEKQLNGFKLTYNKIEIAYNELVNDFDINKSKSQLSLISKNINSLYKYLLTDKSKIKGADFSKFIGSNLTYETPKDKIDELNRNIVILITDGYFEISEPSFFSYSPNNSERNKVKDGNLDIIRGNYRFPTISSHNFAQTDIFLFEIKERISEGGEGRDYDILKDWWRIYLNKNKFKNTIDSETEFMFKSTDDFSKNKSIINSILPLN